MTTKKQASPEDISRSFQNFVAPLMLAALILGRAVDGRRLPSWLSRRKKRQIRELVRIAKSHPRRLDRPDYVEMVVRSIASVIRGEGETA